MFTFYRLSPACTQLCLLVRIPLYFDFQIVENNWTRHLNCTLWLQNILLKIHKNIDCHAKETYLHTMCSKTNQWCSLDGQCFFNGFYWLSLHFLLNNRWHCSCCLLWFLCWSYNQTTQLHNSQQSHPLILYSFMCWLEVYSIKLAITWLV